jgi:hypothetical protein
MRKRRSDWPALFHYTIGRCVQRHQESIRFLTSVEAETAIGKVIPIVLGNYTTHKHSEAKTWRARHCRRPARGASVRVCALVYWFVPFSARCRTAVILREAGSTMAICSSTTA